MSEPVFVAEVERNLTWHSAEKTLAAYTEPKAYVSYFTCHCTYANMRLFTAGETQKM
jgi:hypothetical protein